MKSPSVSEKLSELIKLRTISYNEDELFDTSQFRKFSLELEKLFPECHRVMKKEVLNDYALLYTWEGKKKELDPVLFIAHFDVVPVDKEDEWTHAPFSGDIADGHIWGRGTIDIKNQLCAMMEACEILIQRGFEPDRGLYLAWGGDEEVAGKRGAGVLSEALMKRDLKFAFLMDEGGAVSPDQMLMLEKPVALIGVEEKGLVNLTLSCSGKTGHSSMPPAHTSIGIMSRAINRIEDKPFPANLTMGTRGLFRAMAPHSKGIFRIIFKYPGLFGWLLKFSLKSSDNTNAMIRTSQSVTIIKGGYRENVLPDRAECNINFRILPGETIKTVQTRIEKIINDSRINIKINEAVIPNEPILIKSVESDCFKTVCKSINTIWPDAVPAPYLVMGGTDSKYYKDLTDNIFRFSPVVLDKKELEGMHGVNERISIKNLENMVAFYCDLIETGNSSGNENS